jgi:hypothetical protein
VLPLAEDEKSGPKVPQQLEIDARMVERKLERIRQTTQLGRFRFGSTDYDRWAAVYCAVKAAPPAADGAAGAGETEPPARLLIRGESAIIFLGND